MASTHVACPYCRSSIPKASLGTQAQVDCPACGKRLKIRRHSQQPPPPPRQEVVRERPGPRPVSMDEPVTFPAPPPPNTDDDFPTFNSELDDADFGEDWGLCEEDFAAEDAPPPVASGRRAKRKRSKTSAARPKAKLTFHWKQLDLTKLREARLYLAGAAALLLIGWGLWVVLGSGDASGDAAAHVVENSPLPEGIEWPSGNFVAVDPAQLRSTNAQSAQPGWFDTLESLADDILAHLVENSADVAEFVRRE